MQGFNMGRYYPPDATNPPTFNSSSHPLGKRANKTSQGILTVRFELPFAVWCNHCKPEAIVGQGVRFNAEKKKVGAYYSTPIWSFRMKHSACGGWWEIRTDPKNSAYVVVDGARKRDYGPEEKGEGELMFLTEEEREKRRNDAFANFEGKVEDKGSARAHKLRIEELYDQSEVWRDPYDVNAKLRKEFRGERKLLNVEKRKNEGIQNKFSIGIEIAKETEDDRLRAAVVEYGTETTHDHTASISSWTPLFEEPSQESTLPAKSKLKSDNIADKSRRNLQKTLVDNSKSAIDPFLSNHDFKKSRPSLGILKRKRSDPRNDSQDTIEKVECVIPQTTKRIDMALVDYDSD